MATTTGIELKKSNIVAQKESKTLKGMLASADIKKRFDDILGKKSAGFISSVISVASNNKLLAKADPATIIGAAAQAATLDLPINQNLGFAYIIPYGDKAQFQLGYKGYIQLAQRSGQYKDFGAKTVYEGEIEYENRLLDKFKFGERTSDKVIGYFAYFTLINGFEKYLFVSIEDMQKHAKKYSKNYKGGTDTWGLTDFNTMAEKTVLKRLLSKFGPLSIETTAAALAIQNDGGVIRMDKDGNFDAEFDGETIDADFNEFDTSNTPTAVEDGTLIDAETGEVLTDEQ
ncbi:recombinase RecT [Veillonella caviae]|uniref:recombinase RecT n=2 Tax=Veillonella caviae TaxID=248316 RepID=UPI002A91C174|nr:recombinase RecT [Veillonella caviae]MDD7290359.1 recombinase RecT [Veillonella caviae]MDY6224665.1 recombinase RecT [Veillonella caviae]